MDGRSLVLTSENGGTLDLDERSEIEQLKIGQATQSATLAGAQAAQGGRYGGHCLDERSRSSRDSLYFGGR